MTRDEREPTAREGGMAETRVEWWVQRMAWGRWLDIRVYHERDLAASHRKARGYEYRIVRRTITEEVVP